MRPRARFARVIMSSTAQVAREVETAIAGMNSNEPSDAVDRVGGDDRFSPEVSETLVLDCSFPLLLLNQFLKNQYGGVVVIKEFKRRGDMVQYYIVTSGAQKGIKMGGI